MCEKVVGTLWMPPVGVVDELRYYVIIGDVQVFIVTAASHCLHMEDYLIKL